MQRKDHLIRAVQLAARKLSSSGRFDELIKDVLLLCVEAVGASGGTIYVHEPVEKLLLFQHVLPEELADKLPAKVPDDFGVAGKVFQSRTAQIDRFEHDDTVSTRISKAGGVTLRNMLTVPLMMEGDDPIGVVQLTNKIEGEFDETDVMVLDTVSAISTMAYLNSRLMEQSTRASQLLGMGKVAHDIKNMAAAQLSIVHFVDMPLKTLLEYEANEDQDEFIMGNLETIDSMLDQLKTSLNQVVGYTTLLNDLSAGNQLKPNLQLGQMGETIQKSAGFLESEGRKRHVELRYEIDMDAPPTRHDPEYIIRIVQNLVGNAIKAVHETVPDTWLAEHNDDSISYYGSVTVRYRFVNNEHVLEFIDTGPGMDAATARKILSGTARSAWGKATGSGWGTKIVLDLVSSHNGTIEIDSEIGKGSTFRVTLPQISK